MAVLSICAPAAGVPARPVPIETEQPTGKKITIHIRGDEWGHWHEDSDGCLIVKRPSTGLWVYAVKDIDSGRIKPTDLVVGQDSPPAGNQAGIAARHVRQEAAARRVEKAKARSAPVSGTQGTMRNLVIPVAFTDLPMANTRLEYDNLFNEVGHSTDFAEGSVKDFYKESSYQSLTIQSTVVDPVTLDHDYAYYGQNDTWGEDLLPMTMVRDAIDKLEQRGFDFSQMDADGDGHIDGLTILHAGEGEENGTDPNAIWSHKWELGTPVTYDGVIMQPYITAPAERATGAGINRIGVICHEMGHFLGLPDLYDTDGSSYGVGNFCLMSGGSWNGSDYGSSPAHFSAWCKISLDWITPTVISVAGSYTLGQVKSTPQVYKLQGSFQANEYFLIENRQLVGFDSYLPGTNGGILIWHVDDNMADNASEGQTATVHFKVDLEEAATGDSTKQHLESKKNEGNDLDYFRAENKTTFTDETVPSAVGYDKSPCGLGITEISASDANMTFKVVVVNPMAIIGYIRNPDGAGIDGVLVTEDKSGGWDLTDTDGWYRIPVRFGWTGTIAPIKTAYSFSPTNRQYTNVRNNLSDQNYTGQLSADPNDPNIPTGDTGTLSVQTKNEVAASVNGPIYVDSVLKGTGSWSGLVTAGSHVVGFGTLDGYTKPDDQLVTVVKDQTTPVTGTYQTADTQPNNLAVTVSADPNIIDQGKSSLVLATASGGKAPYEYVWNTGTKGPSFLAMPGGTTTYTVTVTDADSATIQGTVTVAVTTGPLSVSVQADPSSVQIGGSSTITATGAGGTQPYTYKWSTGDTEASITVSPTVPTDYSVTLTDTASETATASVNVNVTQVAAVTDTNGNGGGAPCLGSMAPIGALFIAALTWTTGSPSSRWRKRRRSTH